MIERVEEAVPCDGGAHADMLEAMEWHGGFW